MYSLHWACPIVRARFSNRRLENPEANPPNPLHTKECRCGAVSMSPLPVPIGERGRGAHWDAPHRGNKANKTNENQCNTNQHEGLWGEEKKKQTVPGPSGSKTSGGSDHPVAVVRVRQVGRAKVLEKIKRNPSPPRPWTVEPSWWCFGWRYTQENGPHLPSVRAAGGSYFNRGNNCTATGQNWAEHPS